MSMMDVKRSTQTFSTAKTNTPVPRSDGTNNLSTTDAQKALGDQSVGDVLNKVADPNWVDPSKKIRAVGNNQLDKDAFLKLMLTQMKAQDPTNPMQSHEMAAQLAQFTSLEQLNNINSTLESMKNTQSPAINYQALAFIGKKVSGDSSKVSRAAGDTDHMLNFQLLSDAQKVNVTIKDAAGNVVRKLEFGNLKKGENAVKWNGMTEEGIAARAGEYKVTIEGVGANGGKVWAKTQFDGRITGLNYTPEGPVLMVGSQKLRMSDVKKIEEAGPEAGEPPPVQLGPQAKAAAMGMMANAPAKAPMAAMAAQVNKPAMPSPSAGATAPKSENANQDSKNISSNETMKGSAQAKASDPDNVPPAEEPQEVAGNIMDVPMERELLDQVAKATR